MSIDLFGKWGNPRAQAERANALARSHHVASTRGAAGANPLGDSAVPWQPAGPVPYGWHGATWMHGRSPQEQTRLQERFEQFLPKMASGSGPGRIQQFFDGLMPPGANLAPNAGAGYRQSVHDMRRRAAGSLPGGAQLASGGNVIQQAQIPYQPEFASPDRTSYPVHRNLANIYWRLFYKLDYVAGTGIDYIAELPWGDCEFSGEGVDGEIKDQFEKAWRVCNIRALLPYFVKEYLVLGEACPQTFYDQNEGIWTYVGMHNPDQLEVIYTPFIKMDPIVRFKPDNRLQQVLSSSSDMVRAVRESIPPQLLSALMSGQAIELHPLNFTFLARKQHPYDVRGTSIMSRMWRIFMHEDALYNASIAVARRNACFVKGTPVLTLAGLKPIEEVKIGDKVISGEGRVQEVEQAWTELPTGEGLVEIKAQGTMPLYCTPAHKFKVWTAPRICACGCGQPVEALYVRSGDGTTRARRRAFIGGHHLRLLRDAKTGRMPKGASIEWKVYSTEPKLRLPASFTPIQDLAAADIRCGDYLVIPRKFDARETATRREAARLLGYFAAEGMRRDINKRADGSYGCEGVAFSLSLAEHETWAQDIAACAAAVNVDACVYKHVPGAESKKAKSGREGGTVVYFQRKKDEPFSAWLKEHAVVGANFHRLSEEVMCWPLELKREFIIGYFRGDGHLQFPDESDGRSAQVSAVSTSQTLIYQVRLILAQLGFFGAVYYDPKGDKSGEENWNDCWIVSTNSRDARALARMIWGVGIPAPSRKDRGGASGGAARTWVDENYVYVPVLSVERVDDNVNVYNLTVSGDHSYLAGGVQTFNSPLRVAKLGDPATGWIPGPEHETRLLELLAQNELDPAGGWLCYNYGVEFELVGVQERTWKIEQAAEFIERVKLIALGISKSLLVGETTYASAASGLTIFLQRLKTMREFFEAAWIIPKFFRPLAVMNAWVKPTPAELAHGVRTRRSKQDLLDDNRYIVPDIEWTRQLDPSVESAQITAIQALQGMGVVFSKQFKASLVGRDWEEELNQRARETKIEQQVLQQHPMLAAELSPQGGEGGGGGMMPGLPPSSMGFSDDTGGGEMPGSETINVNESPPGEAPAAGVRGDAGSSGAPGGRQWRTPKLWDAQGKRGNWEASVVADLISTLEGDRPEEDLWERAVQDSKSFKKALDRGDAADAWESLEEWLIDEGYPSRDIMTLQAILKSEGTLTGVAAHAAIDKSLEAVANSTDPDFLVGFR